MSGEIDTFDKKLIGVCEKKDCHIEIALIHQSSEAMLRAKVVENGMVVDGEWKGDANKRLRSTLRKRRHR